MAADHTDDASPAPRFTSAESRAPRVKDVARLARVSVGTVSNVLNQKPGVSDHTRERVERAITTLGFVRNPAARTLRSGVSPLVGVALLDISNPFFAGAAAEMDRRLSVDGCVMILSTTHADVNDEAALLRAFEGQAVRGILLTPTDSDLTVAREIVARGTPVVLFDSTATPPEMSSISVDDHAGAVLAVNHLLSLGHRHIAFLNGPNHVRQARDRADGVTQALRSTNAAVQIDVLELPQFTARAGRDAILQMLSHAGLDISSPQVSRGSHGARLSPGNLPTAVFCANDLIAFGAMTALRDMSIRIPHEISIVGFDDIPIAAQTSVPLTTIRQPMETLGWEAADMLLSPRSGVRHEKFAPELIIRNSTGPPCR